jgi:hypothetical protein
MTGTNGRRWFALFLAALSLGGCATVPTPAGPSVLVLPTPGKPLDLFQAEDLSCRQWASQQIGMSPQDVANQNAANAAAAGTMVGATLGALVGSASGNAAEGAIIGAGSGFLVGASAGAEAGAASGWEVQRRYDNLYQQCMSANGNVLPGMTRRVWSTPPPPPGGYYSRPHRPQGYLPPPPRLCPRRGSSGTGSALPAASAAARPLEFRAFQVCQLPAAALPGRSSSSATSPS